MPTMTMITIKTSLIHCSFQMTTMPSPLPSYTNGKTFTMTFFTLPICLVPQPQAPQRKRMPPCLRSPMLQTTLQLTIWRPTPTFSSKLDKLYNELIQLIASSSTSPPCTPKKAAHVNDDQDNNNCNNNKYATIDQDNNDYKHDNYDSSNIARNNANCNTNEHDTDNHENKESNNNKQM